MKLKTLVDPLFIESLNLLSKANLPAKASYQIAKKIIRIEKEQKLYEQVRSEKVMLLCNKDEKQNPIRDEKGMIRVAPENVEKFLQEDSSLKDLDVLIEPLKISDLGENHGLCPRDLINLGEFITEE